MSSAQPDINAPDVPGLFAPWVEWRREAGRNGRNLITAVNHRDGAGFYVEEAELSSSHPRHRSVVAELAEAGFLPDSSRGPDTDAVSRVQSGLIWRGADRFVRQVHRGGGSSMFRPRWVAAQMALAVVGVVAFIAAIRARPVHLHAEPGQVPAIIALGVVAVFIHELGHALVTVHYGRSVRAAGLRLHLGSPAFYVESVDALLLTRRQRIIQAAAGPWAEWLATSSLALVALGLDRDGGLVTVLQRFLVINTIGLLSNLLPFVGLDGALLLADAIRRPDLACQTQSAFTSAGRRERWLVVYAIVNGLVATGLLVMSLFFWWQLFGELTSTVWRQGPIGWGAVVVFYLVLARDLWRMAAPAAMQAATHLRRIWSRLRFRGERRWRVEAINALRTLPALTALGPAELGVLAGRLERRCGRHAVLPETPSDMYVRRVARTGGLRALGRRARRVVPAGATTGLGVRSIRDLVVLPANWPSYLDPLPTPR